MLNLAGGEPVMQTTAINIAEAITDQFWDPPYSALDRWNVSSGKRHGLELRPEWKGVVFSWERAPRSGPVLRMWRKYDLGSRAIPFSFAEGLP